MTGDLWNGGTVYVFAEHNAGVVLWNFNEPRSLTSSLEIRAKAVSVWRRNGPRLDTDEVENYRGGGSRRRKVARSQLVWCSFHGGCPTRAVVKVSTAGIYDKLKDFKRKRLPSIRLLVMQRTRRDKIIHFCITLRETKV